MKSFDERMNWKELLFRSWLYSTLYTYSRLTDQHQHQHSVISRLRVLGIARFHVLGPIVRSVICDGVVKRKRSSPDAALTSKGVRSDAGLDFPSSLIPKKLFLARGDLV
jgi:hypothetical protein